jgi:hypothetical protein
MKGDFIMKESNKGTKRDWMYLGTCVFAGISVGVSILVTYCIGIADGKDEQAKNDAFVLDYFVKHQS